MGSDIVLSHSQWGLQYMGHEKMQKQQDLEEKDKSKW